MKDFTLQLRCNVCDEVLVSHWRVDTAGVFAHVDPCPKCNATELEAQLAEAREVVRPFADRFNDLDGRGLTDESMSLVWTINESCLRRAAAWLAKQEG